MNFLDQKKLKSDQKVLAKTKDFDALLHTFTKGKKLSTKDLVSIDDLSDADIKLILETAWMFKYELVENPKRPKKVSVLRGRSIINFFCETSTRTRSSFELAGKHLGADTINISASGSSMEKKGESFYDTVRTLNKLDADCIIIRDAHAMAPAMAAKEVTSPVVNAGDGWHEHPSQALLDAFTMLEEYGTVTGKTMAIIGDIVHSRVAGSLMRMARRLDMNVRLVGPRTMIPVNVDKIFGTKTLYDVERGLKNVDVAYALRVQTERAAGGYIPTIRDYSKLYCVNSSRLPLLNAGGIVMHPGPVNREVDIATEVLEGPQSRVEHQVQNGLPIRMAILYLVTK